MLHQFIYHLLLQNPHSHGYNWIGYPHVSRYPISWVFYQSSFQGPQPWFLHTIERYDQAYLLQLCYKNWPCCCLKFWGTLIQIMLWSVFWYPAPNCCMIWMLRFLPFMCVFLRWFESQFNYQFLIGSVQGILYLFKALIEILLRTSRNKQKSQANPG